MDDFEGNELPDLIIEEHQEDDYDTQIKQHLLVSNISDPGYNLHSFSQFLVKSRGRLTEAAALDIKNWTFGQLDDLVH